VVLPSPFPPPPRKLDIIERDDDDDDDDDDEYGCVRVNLSIIGVLAVLVLLDVVILVEIEGGNIREKQVAVGMIRNDNVTKNIAQVHLTSATPPPTTTLPRFRFIPRPLPWTLPIFFGFVWFVNSGIFVCLCCC